MGDHAANGEAEKAVKGVKRQIPVLKNSSGDSCNNKHVPADHPLLTWLPRHGVKCLTKYRIGEDGKAAKQRRTGKQGLKPALDASEPIHFGGQLLPRSRDVDSNLE